MAQIEVIMPKMGESIIEATILKWVKNVGDQVEMDETILEIATDKVDSEVPSPASGVVAKVLFQENDVVEIGKVIAVIATEGESVNDVSDSGSGNGVKEEKAEVATPPAAPVEQPKAVKPVSAVSSGSQVSKTSESGRFYSPLVRNIAKKENISMEELEAIAGTGLKGRVTKKDILAYIESGRSAPQKVASQKETVAQSTPKTVEPNVAAATSSAPKSPVSYGGNVEIIEMDRMRKLIADHMVMSKRTSAHVTSYVEVDVTEIAHWRNQIKADFIAKHGQKITFTPIFIEAIAKAIGDFPLVNSSLDNDKIIVKKDINIGMAAALPSGNLIVPVIKNADSFNLVGLTKIVNDLANRSRNNKLTPDEIQGGTFTMTNVGSYGDEFGTPIINQPQVAIMATGAIKKKPVVIETEHGDVIAIRHMMYLGLSYDHRIVDGFLGGSFANKVKYYLEHFDTTQTI